MSWFTAIVKAAGKVAKAIATKEGSRMLKEQLKGLPKRVTNWWNGKKIAIIGPTAAGKDSFYRRLQGKSVPETHRQTRSAEKVPSFKYKAALPDGRAFAIHCKRCINIGGETDQRERFWFEACKDADVIFYMLTLDDLQRGRYKGRGRVNTDLKWLTCHMGQMKDTAVVYFLINKIDTVLDDGDGYEELLRSLRPCVNDFETSAKRTLGEYQERLKGVTLTSMTDDHIFAVAFPQTLKAVYDAVHS